MATPVRMQRKRSAGWRMPPNTVYVGRPTKWGNPFTIGETVAGMYVRDACHATTFLEDVVNGDWDDMDGLFPAPAYPDDEEIRRILSGRNLACWCQPGARCHADVLLRIANRSEP